MKNILKIFIFILTITLGCFFPHSHSSASKNKPVFSNKCNTITVGKSVRFTLRPMKKAYHVVYSSSNKKIASIHRKTGKCIGKKPGKVTIYAKIYDKNHKKGFTVKKKLTVHKKSWLPNASFYLVQSINPYNYTIRLKCSRILLKKEVQKSKLILRKKGSSSLSASFSALSPSGKEITYTLSQSSQKKLCPKNGSMNGNYTLSSSLFRKKLSVYYQERIGNYSLSGFVLSAEGAPVNHACVKCLTRDSVKTCYTDNKGFYHFTKIKNPSSLTVTKTEYFSETLSVSNTDAYHTRCENIILHSAKRTDFSAQFHVTEKNGVVIPQASVFVLPSQTKNTFSQEDILFSGETDCQGNILFYSGSLPTSSSCTKWNIGNQETLTYETHYTPTTTHRKKVPSFSLNKSYSLFIGKLPQKDTPGYEFRKFTFCPKDCLSRQFYFHVTLANQHILPIKNLSLKWDSPSFSLCSSLLLSFYQKGTTKPVLNARLTKEYFMINNNLLSFTKDTLYTLPDGAYYLKIKLLDKDNKELSVCPMTPLSISNGSCSPKELLCLPPSYCRILAYGNFHENDVTLSFERYVLIDGQYFYLDTINLSNFSEKEIDMKTASIYLPNTEGDTSYLLYWKKGTIRMKNPVTFYAAKEYVFSDTISALSSPPVAAAHCVSASELSSTNKPKELLLEKISPAIMSEFTATKSYIRSAPCYPNTMIVIYKKEGTFLSASLTIKSYHNINNATNPSIMIDIYTNGEKLVTTQKYY